VYAPRVRARLSVRVCGQGFSKLNKLTRHKKNDACGTGQTQQRKAPTEEQNAARAKRVREAESCKDSFTVFRQLARWCSTGRHFDGSAASEGLPRAQKACLTCPRGLRLRARRTDEGTHILPFDSSEHRRVAPDAAFHAGLVGRHGLEAPYDLSNRRKSAASFGQALPPRPHASRCS
jgi:hypothetical protein